MTRFQHVLVPTDFSETARDALRMARRIADGSAARISVLHVIPDVMMRPRVVEGAPNIVTDEHAWEADIKRRLEALVAEEGLTDARTTTTVLVGPPAPTIVQHAAAQRVDLIVMGTHGHGPIRRFLLGSVAERVVRLAPCPVLTVPHESLRHPDDDEPDPQQEPTMNASAALDRSVDEQC